MQVSELVQALETVAPTLGMGPIMEHYWFTGKHVVTYDDHLAMQVPCSIGMSLTVSGRLLPLLKASYQSGVLKLELNDKDELEVSFGKFHAMLPTHDIRDANTLFQMPELKPNAKEVTGDMARTRLAIAACKLSVDDAVPHRNGMTLIVEDGRLCLYAFNNDSLTRCTLGGGTFKHRIMLPAQFWNILLSLTGKNQETLMMLEQQRALVQVGNVLLFAKTVEVPNPTDLRALYDNHFATSTAKRLIHISAEFHEAIKRAAVLSKDDKNATTKLEVRDNELNVYTDSLHGIGDDWLKFPHPDSSVTVRPQPLLDALERFAGEDARVAIGKRVVALEEAGRVHLLSGKG